MENKYWQITGTLVIEDTSGWKRIKQIPATHFHKDIHGLLTKNDAENFAINYFRNMFAALNTANSGLTEVNVYAELV